MSDNNIGLVESIIGSKVRIETKEGAILDGKLTNINYIEVALALPTYSNPVIIKSPVSINFNHDPAEVVDWNVIATIKKL